MQAYGSVCVYARARAYIYICIYTVVWRSNCVWHSRVNKWWCACALLHRMRRANEMKMPDSTANGTERVFSRAKVFIADALTLARFFLFLFALLVLVISCF
jgi:hypothetical protein